VVGTYDLLRFTIADVSNDPDRLLKTVRGAEERALKSARTVQAVKTIPLSYELTDETRPYELKAVEYQTEESSVSGATRVVFGSKPVDLTVPIYDTFRVKAAVSPPIFYVIPPEWQDVIQRLETHGLELKRLVESATMNIESYRFTDVHWPAGPFEGRQMPSFSVNLVQETRLFPAGSILVPVAQKGSKVVINLLEPHAPDSLVAWGFFNAIFEQKEYAEEYILEQLAREMLTSDPGLYSDYQERLAGDPEFSANPRARLEFFYERSPYWDARMNLYPVGRITSKVDLKLETVK
jgi:hypothetical protein